ncbi:MAG: hypothetical protein SynsKO_19530 [Synoicihabitans sp.]
MSVETLQAATPADASEIRALLESVNLPTADLSDTSWSHFWVARSKRGIVGVVGLEPAPPFALLRSLGVAVELQGTGLGQRLLKTAEQNAADLGIRQLGLITDSAAAYFQRYGFEPVERSHAPAALTSTRQFREICPESAILMLKSTG